MGVIVLGLLLGWVLACVALSFFVSWLISKADFFPTGKIKLLRLTLTLVLVASPFLYWSIPIYSFGWFWVEECEERTGYIFHSQPPLDLVDGPGLVLSSAASSWIRLAETDIRSLVATDKRGRGLTGEDGSFVLRQADANDPGCAPFYAHVAKKKWKKRYLGDRCITIEPLNSTVEVLKLEVNSGESNILHKWGSLVISESRSLLQNADSKEVYAEYVHVNYRYPNVTEHFFSLFASRPSCEKLDALEKNNLHDQLFKFALSARFRAKIENLNNKL